MMWCNDELHVLTNDKGRGNVLRRQRSVVSCSRVETHAYMQWHDDAWHAAPDTTNTLEEYRHNGHDM